MADRDDMTRRLAVVTISNHRMRDLLRLPEGFDVRSAHDLWTIDGVGFTVQSPSFPVAAPDTELPRLTVQWHQCDACGGPVFDELAADWYGRVSW